MPYNPSSAAKYAQGKKSALVRDENKFTVHLMKKWQTVHDSLVAQLNKVTADIAAQRAAGKEPTVTQIRNSIRFRDMVAQVNIQLSKFATATAVDVQARQEVLIPQAIKDANDLAAKIVATSAPQSAAAKAAVASPNSTLVEMGWDYINPDKVSKLVEILQPGSVAYEDLKKLAPESAEKLSEAILTRVGNGEQPEQVAKAFKEELAGKLGRFLTIARTATMESYRQSQIENMRANDDIVTGWQWNCLLDSGTCTACLSNNGRIFGLSEEMDSHFNCLLGGTIVSGSKPEATFSRWYDGEVIDIETACGNNLSVTENHPILTAHGWVAAGSLVEGSNVISTEFCELDVATAPDDYQIPTRIEDIITAFAATLGVRSETVEISPVDFHSDAANGEVCVVSTDGLLWDKINAARLQPLPKNSLVSGISGGVCLSCGRALSPFLETTLASTARDMRGGGISAMLGGGALTHHEPVGSGGITARNTGLVETLLNASASNTISTGNAVARFTGEIPCDNITDWKVEGIRSENVASFKVIREALCADMEFLSGGNEVIASKIKLDRVLKVSRRSFSGHVYNLQTKVGWYVANGIVTHNCRCVAINVVKGFKPIDMQSGESWLREQSDEKQQEVLSPGKYEAWKAGKITLDDLREHTHSEKYGGAFVEGSLASALAKAGKG